MSPKHRFYRPRHPYRRRIFLTVIILFLAVGSAWLVTALQFPKQIEAWVTAERAAGHEIVFDEDRTDTSPLAVSRHFRNVRWNDGQGASLSVDNVVLTARPWCWRSLEATFERSTGTRTFLAGDPLTFQADHGTVQLSWNGNGHWTSVRKNISGLKVSRANSALLSAQTFDVMAKRPGTAPKDHTGVGLILTGSAENITFTTQKPLPFGQTIAQGHISLRVMGVAPDFANRDTVAAWNAASGIIELDELKLTWSPLDLSMNGTLGLSDTLQPEGAFSGTIGNREAVVKSLADHAWIKQSDVAALNTMISVAPEATAANGSPNETVSLSIQNGGLFVGMVLMGTIPPLQWHKP